MHVPRLLQRHGCVSCAPKHGDGRRTAPQTYRRPRAQAVEKTIQNLIGSGMDPKTDNDPYNGFIYTSFQVQPRATPCCHPGPSRLSVADGCQRVSCGCKCARGRVAPLMQLDQKCMAAGGGRAAATHALQALPGFASLISRP